MVEPYVKSFGTGPALSCCPHLGKDQLAKQITPKFDLRLISTKNIGIFCLSELFFVKVNVKVNHKGKAITKLRACTHFNNALA
jgi:hypothetical protein